MFEEKYVSVLMAEYNTNPEYLDESIESILNQTHKNFELIIIDDCGSNDMKKFVKKYNDKRIKVIKNEKNIGLANSLNKGLKIAKYDYIIRMDTDDICLKDRFEKQIKFAIENPQYSIIGGNHILFDDEREYKNELRVCGEIKKEHFLFNTPFSHPTLILKKDDLIASGGYPNYRRGQDYAMEMQMYVNGFKGYIMEEELIKYRQDTNAYTKKNYRSRVIEYEIRKTFFKKLKLPWYRFIYIIKPLLVGLIPKKNLKKYHENKKNMNKLVFFLKHPLSFIIFLNNRNIKILRDKNYLKLFYKLKFNKELNLEDPKTFNEKLQWLKLNDRKYVYTTMVDKYEVKKYVSHVIGEDYIIPTIGVYDKFDDIDFKELPNKFIIKCTHDSGGLVIVKDKNKLDIKKAKKKINKHLKRNYYYSGREWPYKNVKPRIIIEEYMEDNVNKELRDYKFFCFNGKMKFFKIDFNRSTYHQANYYDKNKNLLKFGEEVCPPDCNKILEMPVNLNRMIKLAEMLSKNIPFLRVDLYEVNGKIYFGELTFYPASGFGKFKPEDCDRKLGDLIDLSQVKRNEK